MLFLLLHRGFRFERTVMVFSLMLLLASAVQGQAAKSRAMTQADQAALRDALDAYDQGKAQVAEPVLARLFRQYPKSYEVNEALGGLYTEANQLDRALPYLREAAVVEPRQALAH